jgi:hypothetical protein
MKTNKEVTRSTIEKADIAVSDLTGSGGFLQPKNAAKFIQLSIRKRKLLGMIVVAPIASPTAIIDKIRFNDQILQPGIEGEALPLSLRSKPNLSKVNWDAKKFMAHVNVPIEVLEDNIEGAGMKNTLMKKATEAVGRDQEKVAIQGDTTSSTPLLAVLDGFLAQLATTVDANGTRLTRTFLQQLLRAMPKEELEERNQLKFFTSINAEGDYREFLASRATGLGDIHTNDHKPVYYSGVEIVPIPMFPETLGVGSDETNVILSHPKNMQVGIWRKIKVKTAEDIEADVFKMVFTLRMDAVFTESTFSLKCTEITND